MNTGYEYVFVLFQHWFVFKIVSYMLKPAWYTVIAWWQSAPAAWSNHSVSNLVNKWTFETLKWNVLCLALSLRADFLDTPSNFLAANLHCWVVALCHLEVWAERCCSQFPDGNSNLWHIWRKCTATSTDSISRRDAFMHKWKVSSGVNIHICTCWIIDDYQLRWLAIHPCSQALSPISWG